MEENLADFEIKKDQILCIVNDNAPNMLRTIQKMNRGEDEKVTTEGEISGADSETEIAEIEQRRHCS
jgi:hypothetical protein